MAARPLVPPNVQHAIVTRSQTVDEQQAWRRATGANGNTVQLTAATSQPPTRFAESGLGAIVAAAGRVRP